MGTSQETLAPPVGEGFTFEKVWASLLEFRESQRESHREIDRMFKETDRRMKETDRMLKETDRRMKETDKRVGEITNRFGDMVEHMVVPNLVAKFQELNFTFTRASPNVEIIDREHNILTEVDAFLENGDKVMIVEIKAKPNTRDIDEHIERMKKLRAYADLREDKRNYLGAVAGVAFNESVKKYTLKQGFYVLEPSGETFTITEPKAEGCTPREW
jgi:hypothetical protein